MSITLTVSFHGGSNGLTNLYTAPGKTAVLPTGSGDPALTKAELRGFTLGAGSDSHLYVVNGYKDSSSILQYTPQSGGGYSCGAVWATSHLHHPFDAVWGPGGYLYVSNQDQATDKKIKVTAYDSSGNYVGDFASGFTELRGITWAGDTLWAADEKGGKGKGALISYQYNSDLKKWPVSSTGSIDVTDPVHVLYDGSCYVYIGSEKDNSVLALDTTNLGEAPVTVVTSSSSVPIDATGGLAILTDGGTQYMLVCSRKGNAINQYQLNSSSYPPTVANAGVFQSNLGDNPEFTGVPGIGVFN